MNAKERAKAFCMNKEIFELHRKGVYQKSDKDTDENSEKGEKKEKNI